MTDLSPLSGLSGLHIPADVQIRPAHSDELEQIFMMRIVAGYQKDMNKPYPPLNVLSKIYTEGENHLLEKEWSAAGARFFVANVPFHEVSPVIIDHKGKALAGFCSVRHDRETNPEIFHFENLYVPQCNYHIGSMLMAHCIHEAQNSEAKRIRFSAPYNKSKNWYEKLGFETAHHIQNSTTKIMELEIANAQDVLGKLYNKIGSSNTLQLKAGF